MQERRKAIPACSILLNSLRARTGFQGSSAAAGCKHGTALPFSARFAFFEKNA